MTGDGVFLVAVRLVNLLVAVVVVQAHSCRSPPGKLLWSEAPPYDIKAAKKLEGADPLTIYDDVATLLAGYGASPLGFRETVTSP